MSTLNVFFWVQTQLSYVATYI